MNHRRAVAAALGALLWVTAMLAAAPPAGAAPVGTPAPVSVHQAKATAGTVPVAPQRHRAHVGTLLARPLVVATVALSTVVVATATGTGRSATGRAPARAPPG